MKPLILVTGGTGYIGSHTTVELIQEGFEVVIVDNLCNSGIEVLDGIESITGVRPHFENFDLCDLEQLRHCCKKYPDLQAVIHFAAFKAVGESVEKPLDYYHNNFESLINLLRVMGEYSVPSLVFSSSCTVYGQPDHLPVTESSPVKKASSPYGNTKQVSEEIIQDALPVTSNLRAISLRYFNPIGAHPSAKIGELPLGVPLNLVPYLTQSVIGKRPELRVFGNDYDTADGTGIRDYIYVGDLAKAHVVAIKRLMDGRNKKQYEVFNLGTGKGYSVMEIIKAFERATGEKVTYTILPRRPGDIAEVYADTTYANTELGWKAETSLEQTLYTAWNWEMALHKRIPQ